MKSHAQAERYIEGVQQLPASPTVMVELLALFKDPDRDIDRVVEVLSYDPSLTAEVFKRCNSAFLGGGQPADNMFEAVLRLGVYEVYTIVAAMFGARTMALPEIEAVIDVKKLWRHSVTTAVIGSVFAKHLDEAESVAFTSGLLHDIGKLILASAEKEKYSNALQQTSGFGLELVQAEQISFQTNHAEIAALLLTRWKLPVPVISAVQNHHQILSDGALDQMTLCVQAANETDHKVSDNSEFSAESFPTDPKIRERLQLNDQTIPLLVTGIKTGLDRVKGLMDL